MGQTEMGQVPVVETWEISKKLNILPAADCPRTEKRLVRLRVESACHN